MILKGLYLFSVEIWGSSKACNFQSQKAQSEIKHSKINNKTKTNKYQESNQETYFKMYITTPNWTTNNGNEKLSRRGGVHITRVAYNKSKMK